MYLEVFNDRNFSADLKSIGVHLACPGVWCTFNKNGRSKYTSGRLGASFVPCKLRTRATDHISLVPNNASEGDKDILSLGAMSSSGDIISCQANEPIGTRTFVFRRKQERGSLASAAVTSAGKECGALWRHQKGIRCSAQACEELNTWALSPSLRDPITRPRVYTLTDPNRLQIRFLRTSVACGRGALKPNWLYWCELWRYWYHA